jgi:hypothetical protein
LDSLGEKTGGWKIFSEHSSYNTMYIYRPTYHEGPEILSKKGRRVEK